MKTRSLLRPFAAALSSLPAMVAGLALAVAHPTAAQTFTILHSFTGSDGLPSRPGLILSGNTLYGTTSGGGSGYGAVFAVNTDGTGFTNLHSFSELRYDGYSGLCCTNGEGANPLSGLILSGN